MAAVEVEPRDLPVLPELERRSVELTKVEFREQSDKMIFEGRAAVFGEWADIGGEFRETIKRGAFRKADMSETVLAFNHNLDLVMASAAVDKGPGSLVLDESARGLDVYAELAPTQTARDTRALVDSKVIRKMSFGWPRGDAVDDWNADYTERSISGFKRIIDVSPVVFPAYTGTHARDYFAALADEIRSAQGTEKGREALQAALRFASQDPQLTEELLARAISLAPDESADRDETAVRESDNALTGLHALDARLLSLRLKDTIR